MMLFIPALAEPVVGMSTEAWIGLAGVLFAAAALSVAIWVGVKQIMVSAPPQSGTAVIRAILDDSDKGEGRIWDYLERRDTAIKELQALMLDALARVGECEMKHRECEDRALMHAGELREIKTHMAAQDQVMSRMKEQINADDTVETPR